MMISDGFVYFWTRKRSLYYTRMLYAKNYTTYVSLNVLSIYSGSPKTCQAQRRTQTIQPRQIVPCNTGAMKSSSFTPGYMPLSYSLMYMCWLIGIIHIFIEMKLIYYIKRSV